MNQNTSTRTTACAAAAPLLPLARHDLLSERDASVLREHLATCAACREELAIYDRVEAAWQRALAPDQAVEPFLSKDNLLAIINDEPGAVRRPERAESSAPSPLPAASRRRPRRLVAGVSALAACLLIAVVIGAAFLAREHGIGVLGGQGPSGPPYQNISDGGFSDISMISANEGWAVGGTYVAIYNHTSDPGTLYETPLLWHYLNGKWSPIQLGIHGQLTSISMDSATDGWAIGANDYDQTQDQLILLHYDGHTWKQVSSQGMQAQMLDQVQMLSPTNGWIVGVAFPVFPGEQQASQATGIWHYDGQSWKAVSLPASLSGPVQQGDTLQVSSISMISTVEGWATATLIPSEQIPPSPTPIPAVSSDSLSPSGVILHYTGGQWEVQRLLPKTYLFAGTMISSTSGWIDGQTDVRTQTADPNSGGVVQQDTTAPLLLHYVQGQWVNTTSRISVNLSGIDALQSIYMQSATNGWMVVFPKDQPPFIPTLLHYNGSQWIAVHLPTIKNTRFYRFSRVFTTSPTEGWAVGSRDVQSSAGYTALTVPVIFHLHNGVWSVVQS